MALPKQYKNLRIVSISVESVSTVKQTDINGKKEKEYGMTRVIELRSDDTNERFRYNTDTKKWREGPKRVLEIIEKILLNNIDPTSVVFLEGFRFDQQSDIKTLGAYKNIKININV